MSTEPALVSSAVAALVTAVIGVLVAFGVVPDLSEGQSAAIAGGVGAVAALIAGFLIRRKVTPAPPPEPPQ